MRRLKTLLKSQPRGEPGPASEQGVVNLPKSQSGDVMPTNASAPLYRYQGLVGPRSIRILHLTRAAGASSGKWQDVILQGELKEASLDSNPSYEALSYAWGNPDFTEDIFIGGHVLKLTPTCAMALRRLLRGKISRTLWVDFICINQSKEPEALKERGQQVQMMDEIYQRASQVNVHLGEGDKASDAAMESLKALSQAYIAAKLGGPFSKKALAKYESLKSDALAITDEFPYGKLHGVFRRAWFSRMWVIQEVAMAQKAMFYCGEYLMRFETIAAGADFTRFASGPIAPTESHWRVYLEVHQMLQEFVRRKAAGEQLKFLTLGSVLNLASMNKKASDPRDKIYALYGICRRLGYQLPKPDYEKDVNVVFTEVTRCVLQYDQTLCILVLVDGSGSKKGLPSWVPDFAEGTIGMRSFAMSEGPGKTYNAAGSSSYTYSVMPDGLRLSTKGRRFGKISAKGSPYIIEYSTTMIGGAPRNTGAVFEELVKTIAEWIMLLKRIPGFPYNEATGEAFCRTLVMDRFLNDRIAPQFLMILRQLVTFLVTLNVTSLTVEQLNGQVATLIQQWFTNPVTQGMLESVMGNVGNKCLIVTESFNIGTTTPLVDIGDIVVLLHGCELPFVVRPASERDGYLLLGPAYVHGIMDGEFWNSTSTTDDEWFTIV